MRINKLTIPVTPELKALWQDTECGDLFEDDNLVLLLAPNSYRPIWETASEVIVGFRANIANLSTHRLEGFEVALASDCNCASVYYLLKRLEKDAKSADCGSYIGVTINDYLLPELEDIEAGNDFTSRQVLLEVEAGTGTMGVGKDRYAFGTRLVCQFL